MALLCNSNGNGKPQPHVVAMPVPGQGHLNPLMRFCKVLASQGFLITFANIDPVHHRIEELAKQQAEEDADGGLRPPQTLADNIQRARLPLLGMDLASDFRISLQPLFEALNSIAPQLELLILQLNRQGPPVTAILSDCSISIPTQMVADKLKIPRIALFPASASMFLLHYYVAQGDRVSVTKVLESLARKTEKREAVFEGFGSMPTIYNYELPCFKHVVDDNSFMWEYITKSFQECFRRSHALVINSFEDLEAPALTALSKNLRLPVYGVGPFVEPLRKQSSTSLWNEDRACLGWLDRQPPSSVLYISFGSVTIFSQPQFEEIVAGLLSSQQRFLCVFRPDLVEGAEDSSAFISDVLARSNGRGHVVDWAPQLGVLSHPSVGGFLTHCGWNSIMEAMAHGMPMICWPYFADQMFNARYVVDEWKVGLRFEASKEGAGLVERHEVERVIKALMGGKDGEAVRKKALWLKEASFKSLQQGGTSHSNIQALIRSLISPKEITV